jgi:diazepam-binding inhibitor (GABA receptor modulator, acyl-CoA-binding protein)
VVQQEAFEAAAQRVQKLSRKPSNEDLLKLYACYKQGSVGDVVGARPSVFDVKGRAKFDAWSKLKGVSQERAQADYVTLAERLVREFG